MHSEEEIGDYKLKLEMLQEKLQKSEKNRLQLEQQLDNVLHKHKDKRRPSSKPSRRRYEQFLDEQKKHSERNKRLMQMLEGINKETTALAARTEHLKSLKLQYEHHVANLMQSRSTSAANINEGLKGSIPILVPTNITELSNNNNDKLAENTFHKIAQNLAGNMTTPAEFASCQWTFAMATPLPAGMLLMPTSSLSTVTAKSMDFLNNRSKATSVSSEDLQERENIDEERTKPSSDTKPPPVDNDTNANLSDNSYTNNLETIDKFEDNTNYVEIKTGPSNESVELADDEMKILNYANSPQEISEEPEAEDVKNLENQMEDLNILPNPPLNDDKTNISSIENEIYGELVEPMGNDLYMSSSDPNNEERADPFEVNYSDKNHLMASSNEHENFNVSQEIYPNDVEYKYEPTLVTTEAELYSQATLEESQNNDFEDLSQYASNNDGNDQINNEPIYENIGYANYDDPQYENVYDDTTVYPGYTYDAATGQYLADESQMPPLDINNEGEVVAFDENNDEENIEGSVSDMEVAVADAKNEEVAPVETNLEKNVEGKSVKPILTTPSGGNSTSETLKKKKRVNFVDNNSQNARESSGPSTSPIEKPKS